MATSMADLGFNIDSSPMRRASRELDRMSGASGKAERSSRQLESATNAVRNAVTGLVAAISVREIVRYADTWQNVANQLRQVTKGTKELTDIQARLVSVAKDTRSNFASTANLYARLARSTTEMSLSTEDLIGLTTTINQSFAVSGATAQEAAAAITQLSQGLAAGALRGEEFNSVSEQAPALMRAISRSLNMTIGDLREFAAQGGITAEIVVTALREASEEIDNNFNKTVATFSQNIEVARTNLLQWVGASDLVNGSVGALGDVIVDLSENIDVLVKVGGAAAAVFGARLAGSVATATGAMLAAQIQSARYQAALASMAGVSRVAATSQLALAGAVRGASAAMALLGGPAGIALLAAGSIYYFRDALFSTEAAASDARLEIESLGGAINDMTMAQAENALHEINEQLAQNAINTAEARLEHERLAAEIERTQTRTSMPGSGAPTSTSRSADLGQLNNNRDALIEREKEVIARIDELKEAQAERDNARAELRVQQEMAAGERRVSNEISAALAVAQAWEDAYQRRQEAAQDAVAQIRDRIDPVGAIIRQLNEDILAVQEAYNLGVGGIDSQEDASRIINRLKGEAKDAIDEIGKITDSGQDGFNGMADSVQNWEQSMLNAMTTLRSMTSEGSQNYRTMTVAIDALNAMQAVNAVINQSSGDPYTSFARMATMAASVASLGYSVGSLSGGPMADPTEALQAANGTGSVLGSANEKTESIANSTEIIASTNEQLVNINIGMLRALQSVQSGITGASARAARTNEGIGFTATNDLSTDLLGGLAPAVETFGNVMDTAIEFMSFGLIDGFHSDALQDIFGGAKKLVDQGIQIVGGQISDLMNDVMVQSFATIETAGGWFSDDSQSDQIASAGSEINRQFAMVFGSIYESVEQGALALGMLPGDIQESLNAYAIGVEKISLEGLNAEEQQAAIEAFFSEVFDGMAESVAPFLTEVQRAGEGIGETMARAATQVQVMEEAVLVLGLTASDASVRMNVLASDALAELMGGVENFASALSAFESNFLSETQQFENNLRRLKSAMGDLPLPETRQGFEDLMAAQNENTKSGQENIATLLKVQGLASDVFGFTEDAAEDAAEAAREAAQQAQQSMMSMTDSAMAALSRSVQAQRDAAQEEYQARVRANEIATAAVRAGLQAIQAELGSIQQAAGSLRDAFDPMQSMRRASALDLIRDALTTGDLTGTGEASKIAANVESSGYQTRLAFEREQAKSLILLTALEEEGEDQLTTAERSLQSLERQREQIQRQHADEMSRLDGIIDSAQEQIDAIRGVDNSILSLAEAIANLSAAIGTEGQSSEINDLYQSLLGRDAGATGQAYWQNDMASGQTIEDVSSNIQQSPEFRIRQLYDDILDRDPSADAIQYWMSAIQSGQTIADVRRNIMASDEASLIKGFANGGIHAGGLRMVGERGPEIEATGSSRIMSNNDLMKSLGASTEMLNELRSMRSDLKAANRALVKSNEKQRELLQRWDQQGLPEERVFV